MSYLLQAEDLIPQSDNGGIYEHGLSLELTGKRIVCLVGPNGSGKTAYLRALAGVDPAAGTLRLLDQDVAALNTDAWRQLRCRVSFIREGAPLLSVVNGISNVMLPALYHQLGRREAIQAQAEELLDYLQYSGPRDLLPARLNQHQRLLLAIARCLMLSPALMFLDEPFHMADEACRAREADLYRRLAAERGLSLLISTHNLGFVKRHAQDIIFIHPQHIRRFDNWADFAADPEPTVQAFLHAAA